MAKGKYAIKWHEGIKVPTDEFPSHKDGSWLEVPPRVKRKHSRKLVEFGRRSRLPEEILGPDGELVANPDYLPDPEATEKIIDILLQIGFRWNWEDGAGEPLPQPSEDPKVMEEISDDELNFIITHIADGTEIPPPKPVAS